MRAVGHAARYRQLALEREAGPDARIECEPAAPGDGHVVDQLRQREGDQHGRARRRSVDDQEPRAGRRKIVDEDRSVDRGSLRVEHDAAGARRRFVRLGVGEANEDLARAVVGFDAGALKPEVQVPRDRPAQKACSRVRDGGALCERLDRRARQIVAVAGAIGEVDEVRDSRAHRSVGDDVDHDVRRARESAGRGLDLDRARDRRRREGENDRHIGGLAGPDGEGRGAAVVEQPRVATFSFADLGDHDAIIAVRDLDVGERQRSCRVERRRRQAAEVEHLVHSALLDARRQERDMVEPRRVRIEDELDASAPLLLAGAREQR
jgi:hypothetical protein